MKVFKILLIVFLSINLCAAQHKPVKVTDDPYYQTAYTEITDMLEGRIPIDFKRAVFLPEWAYLRGNLSYEKYCEEIDSTVKNIRKFMAANNMNRFHTGGNVALFEFFARPYSMNGYKPYTYDYNDCTAEKNLTSYFVTKLMRTHGGQCRSLPMFYKVLAEELGVEACITLAPQHVFLRHRDETGEWRNVELTNPGISKDNFYISTFGISAETIRNRVYMYPLTTKETLAYILVETALGYERLFKDDEFSLQCANKSLEFYYQNTLARCLKDRLLWIRGTTHQKIYGDDEAGGKIHAEFKKNRDILEGLGYTNMDAKLYQQLMDNMVEQQKKEQAKKLAGK